MSETTYIYALHDPRDWSMVYVGKTNNPKRRIVDHSQRPRRVVLRQLIEELKKSNLSLDISILHKCPYQEWQFWEKFWITTVRNSGAKLLNLMPGGNGAPDSSVLSAAQRGRIVTQETRARISASHIGKKMPPKTPEQRARQSAAQMGRKFSRETINKISTALTGRKIGPHSAEWKAKVSAKHLGRKRPPFSSEWRANISAGGMGKTLSPEHRARISASSPRRKLTLQEIENLSAFTRGKKLSEEHRIKLSFAAKNRKVTRARSPLGQYA